MTAPIPALRKLNKAMVKHGLRFCETHGDPLPLDSDHFDRRSAVSYAYTCILCRRKQRNETNRQMRQTDPAWREHHNAVKRAWWKRRERQRKAELWTRIYAARRTAAQQEEAKAS